MGGGRCGSRPQSGLHGAVCGLVRGKERREEALLGCQWASAGREKKKKAGPEPRVGPEWKKMNFSKSNHFPNLFSLFSILSQIQIKFEFNFKSSSPTLNQKLYASA